MADAALSDLQRAWRLIDEEADAAPDPVYRAGLLRALQLLEEVDPDADPGEHVPGRTYGGRRAEPNG